MDLKYKIESCPVIHMERLLWHIKIICQFIIKDHSDSGVEICILHIIDNSIAMIHMEPLVSWPHSMVCHLQSPFYCLFSAVIFGSLAMSTVCGALWVVLWWALGILILNMLLVAANAGFLLSSVVFYTPLGRYYMCMMYWYHHWIKIIPT